MSDDVLLWTCLLHTVWLIGISTGEYYSTDCCFWVFHVVVDLVPYLNTLLRVSQWHSFHVQIALNLDSGKVGC